MQHLVAHAAIVQALFPLCLFAALGVSSPARAQCDPVWQQVDGLPGVYEPPTGNVASFAWWDPDGAGPATRLLVIGGQFQIAGTQLANRVASFDPVTGQWARFGSGMNGSVDALAVLANGELVAAGSFTTAGGVPADRIARWDGTAWHPLGAGLSGPVAALAVAVNGDLVAGGDFTAAGGAPADRIARWDGVAWQPLGAGVSHSVSTASVRALLALSNGELVVGGFFDIAGGGSANNIARWNGTTWSSFGSGTSGGTSIPIVRALACLLNGDIVAAGDFAQAGGVTVNKIARWNGTTWSGLGSGFQTLWTTPSVMCLVALPNGHLIAGGWFTSAGGVSAPNIARWTGASWQGLGAGLTTNPGPSLCLALTAAANGDVFAGGRFDLAGTTTAYNVARYSGATWSRVGSGFNSRVYTATTMANGDLVVGGTFTSAGTTDARFIARRTGSTWLPLGTGTSGTVTVTAVRSNGDLIAGGEFTSAGGVPANRVARWNGSAWQAMGSGFTDRPQCFLELPNGDLLAGGQWTGLTRWDGTAWNAYAPGLPQGPRAMVLQANGDLVAAGTFSFSWFSTFYNRIARWDGAAWHALGAGFSGGDVNALARLPNGHLVAAGTFTGAGGAPANRIARWDGAAWYPLGSGVDDIVTSLLVLPDGDLLVAGNFLTAGGVPAPRIARWDGASWHAVDGGCDAGIECLAWRANGEVVAGGWFTTAGSVAAPYFARLVPGCPATAVAFGTACTSSTGPLNQTPTSLPWIGGTLQTTCSGMPAGALAFALLGFTSPATPLVLLHPAGVAGCDLLSNAEATMLTLPVAGVAASSFVMPLDPAYVGLALRHQFVVLELDAASAITRLAGSNGLLVTLGVF